MPDHIRVVGQRLQFGDGSLETVEGSIEVALRGREQATAARDTSEGEWATDQSGTVLVAIEVGARSLELAQPEQHLDRIRPHRSGRVSIAEGEQSAREVLHVLSSRGQVPQGQLETGPRLPRTAAEKPCSGGHLRLRPGRNHRHYAVDPGSAPAVIEDLAVDWATSARS